MSWFSGIVKVFEKIGAKIGPALTRSGAKAGSALSKVAVRLNKVWIGIGAAICGYLGIKVASGQNVWEALGVWLTTTGPGLLMLTAIIVAIVLIANRYLPRRRRSGRRHR